MPQYLTDLSTSEIEKSNKWSIFLKKYHVPQNSQYSKLLRSISILILFLVSCFILFACIRVPCAYQPLSPTLSQQSAPCVELVTNSSNHLTISLTTRSWSASVRPMRRILLRILQRKSTKEYKPQTWFGCLSNFLACAYFISENLLIHFLNIDIFDSLTAYNTQGLSPTDSTVYTWLYNIQILLQTLSLCIFIY